MQDRMYNKEGLESNQFVRGGGPAEWRAAEPAAEGTYEALRVRARTAMVSPAASP